MNSKSEPVNPRILYIAAWSLILISGLFIFRWIFSPEMNFYVDDCGWLQRAASGHGADWTVFPQRVYNDRPVGALIITAFYYGFGLNYAPYAAMLLSIHIANGILLSWSLLNSLLFTGNSRSFVNQYNAALIRRW